MNTVNDSSLQPALIEKAKDQVLTPVYSPVPGNTIQPIQKDSLLSATGAPSTGQNYTAQPLTPTYQTQYPTIKEPGLVTQPGGPSDQFQPAPQPGEQSDPSAPPTPGTVIPPLTAAPPPATQAGVPDAVMPDVPQGQLPSAPQVQVNPAGGEFTKEGYAGQTLAPQGEYNPNDASMVANQMEGILNADSPLMQRAAALANQYAASRGLQSSSIATSAALGSMLDRALPIAQQDAQTHAQAQQLGWQQAYDAEKTNQAMAHDASMADKNANYQFETLMQQADIQRERDALAQQYQLQGMDHQAALQASRDAILQKYGLDSAQFNAQLQAKRDEQLQQYGITNMELSADLQQQRDAILQNYQKELSTLQNDQRWRELNAQIQADMEKQLRGMDHDMRIQYTNAQASAVNQALEAMGLALNNPNMTPEQQKAAVEMIRNQLAEHSNMLSTLYGIGGTPYPPAPDDSGGRDGTEMPGVFPPDYATPGGPSDGSGGSFGPTRAEP
ncbi:hypothetical protein [Paraferrimonas sedimenticola]|uniref:Uncharacterized protein n=1 Tax=Paraferrimonas sedimenticola TaxID=375674 RepID=A0AA37RUW7_9GAMM|nr:hypothetical protein [Paraferrimonas sedimenticola]GLP95279.1 hypothetical protein GCM10007895_05850 [Paraferrimonas sedimenticola]